MLSDLSWRSMLYKNIQETCDGVVRSNVIWIQWKLHFNLLYIYISLFASPWMPMHQENMCWYLSLHCVPHCRFYNFLVASWNIGRCDRCFFQFRCFFASRIWNRAPYTLETSTFSRCCRRLRKVNRVTLEKILISLDQKHKTYNL